MVIIREDFEGEHVETSDYFFDKIGKPIPILRQPAAEDSTLPSRPLAVSQRHRLLFVAHPSGFIVAKTKDVMDAAKDIKDKGIASSIQDLSLVDVPIGNVRLLSLSADSSTLAVAVDSSVHFFSIDSLLKNELEPCSSCSLPEPSTVKDVQWRKRKDTSYLVLSDHHKLYHGVLGGPLNDVMDNVDAVEWSVGGTFIAVAREDVLKIFSSKFEEKLSISLPFKSWIGDCDDNCIVKVDSIRWIRLDSIVVGCFQQTADGKEENYLLQVIRSKDGKIIDASSNRVVLSFYDLFSGLVDDIVPHGSGPYLFLSYLEQWGLAITANKKNTDQHVVLLGWTVEDEVGGTAAIDIERDTWLPRIELQDNGDDNLIIGLCVDEISLYSKVKVEVGLEEQKQLSPFCVLLCVTLEGKLVMFHVASVKEASISPVLDSVHDEEEDSPTAVPAGYEQSNLSSGLKEQTLEQVAFSIQLQDVSKKEPDINKDGELPPREDLKFSYKSETSMTIPVAEQLNGDVTRNQEAESLNKSFVTDGQHRVLTTKPYQDADGQQLHLFGKQSDKLGQSSPMTSHLDGPSYLVRDNSKLESQNLAIFGSGSASLAGKLSTDASNQSNHKDPQNESPGLAKELPGKSGSAILQGASSQSWLSTKTVSSEGSEVKSLFTTASRLQGNRANSGFGVVSANIPGDVAGKPFQLSPASESTTVNFSVRSAQIGGQIASVGLGSSESLPSIRSSQSVSQETFSLGRFPSHRPHASKDDNKAASLSHAEPNFSRQFGNIKEMAEELDLLLEGIKETGGFSDACTVSQRSSVEALEDGMRTISEKCRMCKSMMDGRLGEIQHLLDKTVQVLARKIYTDGIVKQASDTQYWELWDRQKLSSELELKRQRILELNQDLTNCLVELERHFNTLELHSFGQSGVHTDRRTSQSRHLQYLRSLHNTMTSQLAAAEQLSECLSKQMAVLSIESPVKQKNVKKELFETIGIPYDASFNSPDATKVVDASSMKRFLLSSGSAATKDQSRRQQSSVMKSSDSETARRRRDSIDQSWASFEPTKTTVKRVGVQEIQNSSVSIDGHNFGPDGSVAIYRENQTPSSTLPYSSGKKGGMQDAFPKEAFEKKSTPFRWANDPSLPSQFAGSSSPLLQSNSIASSSVPAFQVSSMREGNVSKETRNSTADKSRSRVSYVERPNSVLINDKRFSQQSEFSSYQKSSVSTELPAHTPFSLTKSGEMSNIKGPIFSSSTIESVKHGPQLTKSPFSETSSKVSDSKFSSSAAAPVPPIQPGATGQFGKPSRSQPGEVSPSVAAFSVPSPVMNPLNILSTSSSSSLAAPTSSAAMPFGISANSSKATIDNNQTTFFTSLSSASTSTVIPSSFSRQSPKMPLSSDALPSSSESSSIEFQHPAGMISPSVPPTLISPPPKTEPKLPGGTTLSLAPSPSVLGSPKTELQPPAEKIVPSFNPTSLPLTAQSLKTELYPPTGKTPESVHLTSQSETHKTVIQPPVDKVAAKTDVDAPTTAQRSPLQPPAFGLNLEPSSSSSHTFGAAYGSQPSVSPVNVQLQQPSIAHGLVGAPVSTSEITANGKNEGLDSVVAEEDEMEEEAPETNQINELSLGSLGNFGIGSTPSASPPRANPFGGSFVTLGANQASSSFTMTAPSGELFRPASFSFPSLQPPQSSPPTNLGAFAGGFGTGTIAPTQSGFGQPAQIGPGQQALGSVLGSFGQSRQLGAGLPGGVFASSSGFGGGFASPSSTGGFSSGATGSAFTGVPSTGGGFAGLASAGRGFASVGSGGGGFAAHASAGGGFGSATSATSGGFAGAASAGGFGAAGGGFGAFGSQQGTGGFSAFGGGPGGTGKPPELFTQMRK